MMMMVVMVIKALILTREIRKRGVVGAGGEQRKG